MEKRQVFKNILGKNVKDLLLEYIKYMSLSVCNTIKAFDNSTLYTTMPHFKLKNRLKEFVWIDAINEITKPKNLVKKKSSIDNGT
jgi:hypothetical protein